MKQSKPLRSQAWFARQDKMGFYYRSWLKNRGFPQDQFEGRPVIGICNTWSELDPCNSHFRTIAEHVRWGVLDAGGFPLEFPVISLGETMMRPTAMLYRNLASMDVEESIRAQSARRRRAADGLRQDDARAAHGRCQRRPSHDRRLRRADARGVTRAATIGSGTNTISMSEQLRAGRDHAGGVPRGRSRDEPLARALHDHGHGLDHGLHGRGARHRDAGQCGDPCRRCAAQSARARGRPAHRGDGRRRPGAVAGS